MPQQFAEEVPICHCEERFSRRGNLEVLDILNYEFASLRSQRQQKDFYRGLLVAEEVLPIKKPEP
jgi:hypothetical protein